MEGPDKILTFEEWSAQEPAETNLNHVSEYDPATEEALPNHPFFRMDRDSVDMSFGEIVDLLLDILAGARAEDYELTSLRSFAKELRKVEMKDTLDVAMVGQQGIGKSLLINALHHHLGLSKTSAGGGACTASAIRFRHRSDTKKHPKGVDATIKFMNDSELKEIIGEHIRNYRHFHFPHQNTQEQDYEVENAAREAEDFFDLVLDVKNDKEAKDALHGRLETANNVVNANRLSDTIVKRAKERIKSVHPDDDRVITFKNNDISALMKDIDKYVATRKDSSSLWPLVQSVDIMLESLLTKHGVCLRDLPGLNDINQTRTASANTFRRKADHELIVTRVDRVTTDELVDRYLRQSIKAHGAKGTVLVLTKKDEFLNDQNAIQQHMDESQQFPFPEIKNEINKNFSRIEELQSSDTDGDSRELSEQEEKELATRNRYDTYLETTAKLAYIEQRAKEVSQEMQEKFTDTDETRISVFSVSSSMYLEWTKRRLIRPPTMTREESGIPALRRHLLCLCADANMATYHNHAFKRMDMLIDKCRRITEAENKDNAYSQLRRPLHKLVSQLRQELEAGYNDFTKSKTEAPCSTPAKRARCQKMLLDVVRQWGDGRSRWNTYEQGLLKSGIVKRTFSRKYIQEGNKSGSFNWNEELSQVIGPIMNDWKKRTAKAVGALGRTYRKAISKACEKISSSISNSSLAPSLLHIALGEWEKIQTSMLQRMTSIDKELQSAVHDTYLYATTESDVRCMIAQLNSSIYQKVHNTQYNPKDRTHSCWFSALKGAMIRTMEAPDESGRFLVQRIEQAVVWKLKCSLRSMLDNLRTDLRSEIKLFLEFLKERECVDFLLTTDDQGFRQRIVEVLPDLQCKIDSVRKMFPTLEADEKMEQGVKKESPGKKLKEQFKENMGEGGEADDSQDNCDKPATKKQRIG